MRRSKLQVNLEILKALVENGKLNPTYITYNAYVNNKSVNECLKFLLENDLVQELENQNRRKFEITNRGIKAVNIANKIDKVLPMFG